MRTKKNLVFTIMPAVTAVAAGVFAWFMLSAAVEKHAASVMSALTESAAYNLERELFGNVESSSEVTVTEIEKLLRKGREGYASEAFERIDSLLRTNPRIFSAGVYLYPKEGSEKFDVLYGRRNAESGASPWSISHSLSDMPKEDPEYEWFWRPYTEGVRNWDDPGDWEGVPLIAFSAPLRGPDMKIVGTFCADVHSDTLFKILAEASKTGRAYLVDPPTRSVVASSFAGEPVDIPAKIFSAPEGVFSTRREGIDYYGAWRNSASEASDHIIVLETPASFFKEDSGYAVFFVALAAVCVAAAVSLAFGTMFQTMCPVCPPDEKK